MAAIALGDWAWENADFDSLWKNVAIFLVSGAIIMVWLLASLSFQLLIYRLICSGNIDLLWERHVFLHRLQFYMLFPVVYYA